MKKSTINLIVALGVITIAFSIYYFYTQQSPRLSFSENDQTLENMLNNTRQFIERREQLNRVNLDLGFFTDERFQSYQSYSTPIVERPVGRSDPFATPEVGDGVGF